MLTHLLNVSETCGLVPFGSGTCWYAIDTYFQASWSEVNGPIGID